MAPSGALTCFFSGRAAAPPDCAHVVTRQGAMIFSRDDGIGQGRRQDSDGLGQTLAGRPNSFSLGFYIRVFFRRVLWKFLYAKCITFFV